jgi:hypothetical protein
MKAAALLIILLSNDGHWLSGTDATATARWTVDAGAVASELAWELKVADVRLGSGRAAVDGHQPAVVKITCPDVRARITLRWEWRLLAKNDGRELERGSENIAAYPANLTRGWAALLKGRRLIIVDRPDGLPALLTAAKVPHERYDDPVKLQTATAADVVVIGTDMLTNASFEQGPLIDLSRAGTAIGVFRQPRADQVLGYPLAPRAMPDRFAWETDDPLLRGFTDDDLHSWELGWRSENEARAIRVGAWDAAETIVHWRAEGQRARWLSLARATQSSDALLNSRAGPGGRLVLCQMPLGDWQTDPRSQVLLGNVLDVLVSPCASLQPAVASQPPLPPPRRSIQLSPGDSR